jgi:hypothetical protein
MEGTRIQPRSTHRQGLWYARWFLASQGATFGFALLAATVLLPFVGPSGFEWLFEGAARFLVLVPANVVAMVLAYRYLR